MPSKLMGRAVFVAIHLVSITGVLVLGLALV
jgi:hypothetical protein